MDSPGSEPRMQRRKGDPGPSRAEHVPPPGAPVYRVLWKKAHLPNPPSERKGAAMAGWNDSVLLFGGDGGRGNRFKDLHILNLETMHWKEVSPGGAGPFCISYHGLFTWKNKAIVYGGYDNEYCNDLHVLDLPTMTWVDRSTIVPTGRIPKPMYGHSVCVWKDMAVVFGGQIKAGVVIDRVYTLDLNTWSWSLIKTIGQGPPCCCYHTMTTWRDKGVVFGGSDDRDVYILQFRTDGQPWKWTRYTPEGGRGPSKRFGHTTAVYGDRAFIAFGRQGKKCYNEVHVLNLVRMAWEPMEATGVAPGERHAHAACRVGGKMVIFGGHGGTYYNDTRVLQLDDMVWDAVPTAPCPRDGHVMFTWRNRSFLWGGDGGGGTRYNDFYELDIDTLQWKAVESSGAAPLERSYHSMSVWDNFAIVYGGYHKTFCDDVHILDLRTMTWMRVEVRGGTPRRRYGHTINVWRDQALLFGGKSNDATFFNDVDLLDLKTMTWTHIETKGTSPSPRYGHSVHIEDDKALMFGGGGNQYYNDLFQLDLQTMTWTQLQTSGIPPAPRNYHSFTVWRKRAFVFGGDQGNGVRGNDMHCLDLKRMAWVHVDVEGPTPHIRCTHSLILRGEECILFGGRDAGIYFNDLRILDLAPDCSRAGELFTIVNVVVAGKLHERGAAHSERPSSPSAEVGSAGPGPPGPTTCDLRQLVAGMGTLPPELLLQVCCFVYDCPAHLMPSERRLRACRALVPTPMEHAAKTIASIVVSLCEMIYGNLDDISKHAPQAESVRASLRRFRKVVETKVRLPPYTDRRARSQVVAFIWERYHRWNDEWEAFDSFAPTAIEAYASTEDDADGEDE